MYICAIFIMQIIYQISVLKESLQPFRKMGSSIGFVPTMGALHEGHLSLMRACVKSNDCAVASIYVNPTQFNDKNDLRNYPRNPERDCEMLRQAGCNIVFIPGDDEMYPIPDNRIFDFGFMGNVMEGKHRPGHFNGVAQIVTKLFDAVSPDNAYFGQKDFQQLAIVRKLVADMNYAINVVACPIVREKDGLAMSSRNRLLSAEARKSAPLIYRTLKEVKKQIHNKTVSEIEVFVKESFNHKNELKLEYFTLVESDTLLPVQQIQSNMPITACIAVFAGKIRLIDNIELNS
jgi:pantoate--beta-alanine ligase